MNCQDHLYRNADPAAGRPPLVPPAVRRRAGRDGARAACWARRATRPPTPARRRLDPLAPRPPHFAPKAKRVIFLFMAGGPSHLELFDNKPSSPSSTARCRRPSCSRATARRSSTRTRSCSGPKFKFAKHGQCGAELSELLPHLAEVVDDIAIVKSMVTDAFNHAPGQILMNTGSQQFGRPSLGAWVTLRPGQRVAGPARLRRLQHRQEGAQRRQLQLGQRLPADRLPGRPVPQRRRPGALPLQPAGASTPSSSATRSTPSASSTSCGSTTSATPRSPRGSTPSRWPSACRPAPRS